MEERVAKTEASAADGDREALVQAVAAVDEKVQKFGEVVAALQSDQVTRCLLDSVAPSNF